MKGTYSNKSPKVHVLVAVRSTRFIFCFRNSILKSKIFIRVSFYSDRMFLEHVFIFSVYKMRTHERKKMLIDWIKKKVNYRLRSNHIRMQK